VKSRTSVWRDLVDVINLSKCAIMPLPCHRIARKYSWVRAVQVGVLQCIISEPCVQLSGIEAQVVK
jgi:hypothetical protein